ncbi:DUF1330 domain-containing protein [Microbulbifer epialgicus]|uniref:DUF1330 domain-containing protein n=1 Tax=Microbulbifer epialgicus TaxID=393907 RepID=A0ABV4P6Q7_9GAMM
MIYLFMHATVKDFDKWNQVLADFEPKLKNMGATATSVYREVNNPNDVTVIHEFPSKEQAKAFVTSSELHEARKQSHVIGNPKVWYTEKQ